MSPLPKIAIRNVLKNARRSSAALVSLAAGFFAMASFAGYVSELEGRFADVIREKQMLGDLILERAGVEKAGEESSWEHALSVTDQRIIDESMREMGPRVQLTTRSLSLSGLVTSGKKTAVFLGFGYDVESGAKIRGERFARDVSAGKTLLEARSDKVVIAGEGLARLLGCSITGEGAVACKRPSIQLAATTEGGRLNAVDAQIVGTVLPELKEMNVRFMSMPLALAQRLSDSDRVSRYIVKLRDKNDLEAFKRDLVANARSKGLELDAKAWNEHRFTEMYKQGMGMLHVFRAFVAVVVVLVAGMSVFNTMAKIVNERIREIGALRALGFSRRQIIRLFLLEGGALGLLGVSIGALVSLLVAGLVNVSSLAYDAGMTSDPIVLAIAVHPDVYLEAALFLVVVGLFAAWMPARRAALGSIPDALTHA
ncbi:MAG: FtsX-like permease family protein [Deltaproteobacteria bacterium]|nr:FtsX-like permease family protein [Deltaproteobacteria bacterium]